MSGKPSRQQRAAATRVANKNYRRAIEVVFPNGDRPQPSRDVRANDLLPEPPSEPVNRLRQYVRDHTWLAVPYRVVKRIYKKAGSDYWLSFFVAPAAVTASLRLALELIGLRPDTIVREILIDALIFLFTAAVVRLTPYLDMIRWLSELLQIKRLSKDHDRQLLVNMVNTQLFELRASLESMVRGDFTPSPPSMAASYFATFFEHGGPQYIGIDSNNPRDYMEKFAWFLEAHSAQIERDGNLVEPLRREDRRVIISTANDLTELYLEDPERYVDLVDWHAAHGVGLFWISPDDVNRLRNEYGLPRDVDLCLWNNYGVTFSSAETAPLRLAIVFPKDDARVGTFSQYRSFAIAVVQASEILTRKPPGLDVVDRETAIEWPQYVGYGQRMNHEGDLAKFFRAILPVNSLILDAAAGIGCDSALLMQLGYSVVSNEIDVNFSSVAEHMAQSTFKTAFDIRHHLWQHMPDEFAGALRFDALLCIGNSLCLVDSEQQRLASLVAFKKMLRPGASLIVDERNFEFILRHRARLGEDPSFFPGLRNDPMYRGAHVKGYPVAVTDQVVTWSLFSMTGKLPRSLHEIEQNSIGQPLHLHPFRYGELYQLLEQAGFRDISVYADLNLTSTEGMPAFADVEPSVFLTYVAKA